MAKPKNTGSRAVRVEKPANAAASGVSAFRGPVAYGPGAKGYTPGKRLGDTSKKTTRPRMGQPMPSYAGGMGQSSSAPQMHKLQAYNAYGQPYQGAPQVQSNMVGTRGTYVDPMTGQRQARFVGGDSYMNHARPRYTFMGQAPGTAFSFVGGGWGK
jgi:hypothetical protein